MSTYVPIPDRERQAKEEIGHTEISRARAWALTAGFLLIIFGVPLAQVVHDSRDRDAAGALDRLPALARHVDEIATRGLIAANRATLREMDAYETALDDDSVLGDTLRQPVQALLTERLHTGTEEVYTGRDGWLFYRPAVDHLTGAPFLAGDRLEARRRGGKAWEPAPQPDPRLAVAEFIDQLRERNITLVLLPVPVKAAIHPGQFSARYSDVAEAAPLRNPSTTEFMAFAEARGARVFDATDSLVRYVRESDRPAFLKTDTHWTAQAMEVVASDLASLLAEDALQDMTKLGTAVPHVRGGQGLPALPGRQPIEAIAITAHGDLVRMLGLPDNQDTYPPETAHIRQLPGERDVSQPSPVLLLGDSFANIYSDPLLGWGEHAGLVEHLAERLGQPVDRIIRNDNGAFATRVELATELRRGNDLLKGRRVVVWEFSERELSFGDWKSVDLVVGEPDRQAAFTGEAVLEATIADMGTFPRPGTVPYPDHITWLKLEGFSENNGLHPPLLAYVRTLDGGRATTAASLRAGQRRRFLLRPWNDVKERLGSIRREEAGDELMDLDPLYAELMEGETPPREPDVTPPAPLQTEPVVTSPAGGENGPVAAYRAACTRLAADGEGMTVRGVDGWLFHRGELAQMAGGPFWGEHAATAGRADRRAGQQDPLAAIVAYDQACREQGIHLLLAPIPAKSAIYPEKLDAGLHPPGEQRVDTDHAAFYGLLEEAGVHVLDPVPFLLAQRKGEPLFCRQDTHTSPRGLQLIARTIADRIRKEAWVRRGPGEPYAVEERTLTIRGDLRQDPAFDAMEDETLALPVVRDPAGELADTDPDSPVLLLSDSHGLVFSAGGDMHTRGAGLPEQLAKELGYPVDVIAVRGSAARPARINLYREARDDPDYLEQKKVIVWCFTVREFTDSAWGDVPLKR